MKLKRILNTVLSVFGIVLMCLINWEAVVFLSNYGLKWSNLPIYAVTEFSFTLTIVLLFIFLDFTKRQILSKLGLMFLVIDLVYKAFVYIPNHLVQFEAYSESYAIFKSKEYFELICLILIAGLFIQYIFVKKKSNAFMKFNIFLAPVLYAAPYIQWLFNTSGNDFFKDLMELIFGGYTGEMCMVLIAAGLVLLTRYRMLFEEG